MIGEGQKYTLIAAARPRFDHYFRISLASDIKMHSLVTEAMRQNASGEAS